jgi:hypothetical protein
VRRRRHRRRFRWQPARSRRGGDRGLGSAGPRAAEAGGERRTCPAGRARRHRDDEHGPRARPGADDHDPGPNDDHDSGSDAHDNGPGPDGHDDGSCADRHDDGHDAGALGDLTCRADD